MRFFRTTFFLFCLVSAILLHGQSKKYPALLWEISGNGLKKSSYLYGTMHVSNKVAFHLSDQFFDALKSVDVVALETDPSIWLQNMETYGMFDEFKLNSSYYGGSLYNFYKDAFKLHTPNNKVYAGLMSINPDIINGLLYRKNQFKENFEESTYIDLFIYQCAAKMGKQICSLEDFRSSIVKGKLADFRDEGPESEIEDGRSGGWDIFKKIEDAYRKGDLDALDSLNHRTGASKNYQKYLLDDRNVFFVRTIDSILKKQQTLFAGMGAAHLPGEKGVIEMLRSKGYTVKPVANKTSSRSDKLREQFDAKTIPVKFIKQYSDDSLFTFSAPGVMTEVVSDNSFKYLLYADMANGIHYSFIRLKTFGPLLNQSKQAIKQKLDSLLYESVPGKIISKEESTTPDYINIDLTSVLKNTDVQRYSIFITETEVSVFKIGGKGDYAKGAEAKTFFNSIQFLKPSLKSFRFAPPTKGFSADVSKPYFYTKTNGVQTMATTEDLSSYNYTNNTFNGVIHSIYSEYDYLEEDTFELNILANNVLENFNFKKNVIKTIKADQGFPSVVFSATDDNNKKLLAKIFINGIHYYLVYSTGSLNSLDESFIKSFKLTDFAYTNTLIDYTDKDYAFKVKDESAKTVADLINDEVNKEYESKIMYVRKDLPDTSYKYSMKEKFYFAPSTGEHINIEMEKFNDYDFRDRKEFDKNILDFLKVRCWCTVRIKNKTEKDGMSRYELILSDTATSRVVSALVLIKNGVLYQLRAMHDSVQGLKGWSKDFFASFTPLDSVIGKDVFKSKYKQLLNDLVSVDTVVKKRANNSIADIFYKGSYSDDLIWFIKNRGFDSISEYSRASLLVNVADSKNDKVIEPFKMLYNHYTDSTLLQFSVLKGLAYLQTPKAYAAALDLLTKNPPLAVDQSYVEDLFYVFYDSLELCRNFYPSLMTLTKYEEYKVPVYKLLAELHYEKLVKPEVYAAAKARILDEANIELKKHNLSYRNNENYLQKNSSGSDKYNQEDYNDLMSQILNGALAGSKLKRYANYPKVVYYSRLLSPFYSTDPAVKQFYGKLFKTRDIDLLFESYISLIRSGTSVSDSVITYFAKNNDYRSKLYYELEEMNKLSLYDTAYLSQNKIVEAEINKNLGYETQTSYLYGGEKTKPVTVSYYTSIDVTNRYRKGKIYIYKRSDSIEGLDKWVLAFVQAGKKKINPDVEVMNTKYLAEKNKTDDYYYNDIKSEFYFSAHKRYVPDNKSQLFNYDY
jgi:uncharacterized protein YbaP (TraB family)/L-rhamnose mutarotase